MATTSRPRRKTPMSSAGKRGLGRVGANAKRGWKKTLRKYPIVGVLTSVALGIVAVVSLLLGVILESALYYLVMALSGLGALAIRRAQQMAKDRQAASARPRPTSGGPKKPTAPPSSGATPPPASGPVKCTETGKPIADCGCSSRHVATQEGVKTFGRPLGSPLGRKKKQPKPSATV